MSDLQNRTNVRSSLGWWSAVGWMLDLAPRFAARRVIDGFTRTGRLRHQPVPGAVPLPVTLDGRRIPAWSAGVGRAVVLVHGWSGRGSQLAPFVAPLVAAGLRPVWFDAPGHGEASGRTSNLGEMLRALLAVEAALGEAPIGLVAHSFGGVAAAIAAQRGLLRAERLVTIGTPADGGVWLPRLVRALGGSDGFLQAAIDELCGRARLDWSELRIAERPVGRPALILHDCEDREVPVDSASALGAGWGAAVLRTRGLGHRRILAVPEVVGAGVAFVGDGYVRRGWWHDQACSYEQAALERALFDRDHRAA